MDFLKLAKEYRQEAIELLEKLVKIDSVNADKYKQNTDAYIANLQELEQEIENMEYFKIQQGSLFKLEKDIDRQIKGYSHGMKQKLVVIASIIFACDVVLYAIALGNKKRKV